MFRFLDDLNDAIIDALRGLTRALVSVQDIASRWPALCMVVFLLLLMVTLFVAAMVAR
jgi:hypothetical protein